VRRLWIAFVVAAAAVAMWPAGNAGATAPFKTGYWVQAQAAALPVGLPAPPDPVVPKGGLIVTNGPDGPKATSAVAYEVDGVARATLVLKVQSVAPPPAGAPSPSPTLVHLAACAVLGDWDPTADGGSGKWEQRPAFDTANCGFGVVSADGATVTFELPSERQSAEGLFNLAIVPDPSLTGQANTPFSVTFQAPAEDSLAAGDPEPVEEEEAPEPIFDPAPADSEFDPGTFAEFTGDAPPVFLPPLPQTVTPSAPVTSPRRVVLPPRTQPAVAVPGDGRGERIMAVSLLMALATGWWWFGGQQARGPQLLGSLASEGRRPARSAEPTGGIGRFARPRLTKPRPLI
jgi:hypothetical protein